MPNTLSISSVLSARCFGEHFRKISWGATSTPPVPAKVKVNINFQVRWVQMHSTRSYYVFGRMRDISLILGHSTTFRYFLLKCIPWSLTSRSNWAHVVIVGSNFNWDDIDCILPLSFSLGQFSNVRLEVFSGRKTSIFIQRKNTYQWYI